MVEVLPEGRPVGGQQLPPAFVVVVVVGLLSIRFDLADDHPKCNLKGRNTQMYYSA